MNFATNFYQQAKEYQDLYKLTDEWLGFAMGYCLFQPMIVSSEIPELLDLSRQEYSTIKDSINAKDVSQLR